MDRLNDDVTDKDNLKFTCERDWRKLRDVQAELQHLEPQPVVVSLDPHNVDINNGGSHNLLQISLAQILHEHEKRLKAELHFLRETALKTQPENADLQLLIVEQDQVKRLDQLKDTLIYSRAIRSEVIDNIKQQQETYSSLSCLNKVLKKKIAAVEQVVDVDETDRTLQSALTEMTSKSNKVKEKIKYFKNILTGLLSNHFPLPGHKGAESSHNMNSMLSLDHIVGRLIEQSLNSPEQPYIDVDEKFWPPHIEFLLRCQIVLKHPQNSHRIKLVPFHL